MKMILGLRRLGGPTALAIGVFDGVHKGHQAILGQTLRLARTKRLRATALTFDQAPERVLSPEYAPPQLISLQEKLERLKASGIAQVVVVPFNKALARLEAERFVSEILVGRLRAKHVVVGQDFVFGKQARGNVAALRAWGAPLGMGVTLARPVLDQGRAISSTRIRNAVLAGAMLDAKRMLGRAFMVRGQVVRGRGLGRQLGFPTANLQSPQEALPPKGVWAAWARWVKANGSCGPWIRAAANIGQRPSVEKKGALKIELHLIDFEGKLYGQTWEADFVKKLRPELRFSGVEALRDAIAMDVAAVRKVLARRRVALIA